MPKDWPQDKRLVWTLTNRGRTNLAKGWLQPEWEVDDLADLRGCGFRSFPEQRDDGRIAGNKAPVVTGGPDANRHSTRYGNVNGRR